MKGAIPSVPTIQRKMEEDDKIIEGTVQISKLKTFLTKRNYPLKVFISEDQTALIRRVDYDSVQNKMVGFVLPLNEKSRFPLSDTYFVNSVQDIQNAFQKNELSNYAYVFMAQPLVDKAPAFCLSLFGSINKFTSEDVLIRWKYVEEEARKEGIIIEGFSSDGDTRCLKAMKILSQLPNKDINSNYSPYFQVSKFLIWQISRAIYMAR